MEGELLLIPYYTSGQHIFVVCHEHSTYLPTVYCSQLTVHFDFPGIILADDYTITSAFTGQRATGECYCLKMILSCKIMQKKEE
jgi:hypothetical protein